VSAAVDIVVSFFGWARWPASAAPTHQFRRRIVEKRAKAIALAQVRAFSPPSFTLDCGIGNVCYEACQMTD